MPQLLIRNVDEGVRQAVAGAAARNGRSMQAELLATITEHYRPSRRSFVDALLDAGSLEGPDFVLPEREPGRDVSFE